MQNKYRRLIESLKRDYLGQQPFTREIISNSEESGVEKNEFLNEIVNSFSITMTYFENERYNHIKKYDIVSKLNQKKWSFLLVPTGILFAKNMLDLREEWMEQYSIKGIVTLKNSFFGVYVMPVSIILLGNQDSNVFLTSATSTDDILDILSDISSYKRRVHYTKKLDSKSFMPEFYNEKLDRINEKLDKYDTKELQDIAEIILGRNVERSDFSEEGIPYLRVRNVQNGNICNLDSFVIIDCAEKYAKQLLQEGDILLSKNFGQHKVARVNEEDLPAIASNGFFIIRPYGVPEDYLYQYFISKTGKTILENQLSSIEHGTVIMSISKKDLMKIRVPVFDKVTMIDIGNIEEVNASDLMKDISAYSKSLANEDNSKAYRGLALEQSIYTQFLQKGWTEDEVLLNNFCNIYILTENVRFAPDIVLMDGETKLAIVEVKSDLSRIIPDRLMKLKNIIYSDDIPFVILATTGYFEIHSSGNAVIKKETTAPTKRELLQLLEGREKA